MASSSATNSTEQYAEILDDEEELRTNSLYFVFSAVMLSTVLVLRKKLHESPFLGRFLSEAALDLMVGMLCGGLVYLFLPNSTDAESSDFNDDNPYALSQSLLSFSPNVFFMALLPPIIFYSGYQLNRELFYRNITPILSIACIGTTLSACCTGTLLYGIVNVLDWMPATAAFAPTIWELLTFGALIAATDTVSVLSVFSAKKVDPHLFALVFGESALNDAVALVLFQTFADYLKADFVGAESPMRERATAFVVELAGQVIGSPLLGILFGWCTALLFRKIDLREYPQLELPLFMLLMYLPFVVAECLDISGMLPLFETELSFYTGSFFLFSNI